MEIYELWGSGHRPLTFTPWLLLVSPVGTSHFDLRSKSAMYFQIAIWASVGIGTIFSQCQSNRSRSCSFADTPAGQRVFAIFSCRSSVQFGPSDRTVLTDQPLWLRRIPWLVSSSFFFLPNLIIFSPSIQDWSSDRAFVFLEGFILN